MMNSMENLRFDKEDYFHVLVLYTGYFKNEIESISLRVHIRYRNTRESLGELEIACKHSWKFERTWNCVETLVKVWENLKLRGNTRESLGELEIASKHSWKFERTWNCVQTLVKVWENLKLRANTRESFYNCMETQKMFSIS